MVSYQLNELQLKVINSPVNSKIFLEGLPGTGKTSAAVSRLQNLVSHGFDPSSVLILVPQRSLAKPYESLLENGVLPPGSHPLITTLAGLGQQINRLFWPLTAERTGFRTGGAPQFLSIETSQYYLYKIIQPLLEHGLFESVTLDRNRLLSQVLDNLNKSAIVGFPSTEISQRLISAQIGDKSQFHIYEDCQKAADLFREFCLNNNLVDYSLNMRMFCDIAWNLPECRSYLNSRFQHLIYDNIEEDTPTAHDLIQQWLQDLESSLLIMDNDGGYRTFLGADPLSARHLKGFCDIQLEANEHLQGDGKLIRLAGTFKDAINRKKIAVEPDDIQGRMAFSSQSYLPDMVRWVCDQVESLVSKDQVPPGEIAIVAPFLSDSLRFLLTNALQKKNIPVRSYRPSRSLNAEPPALCMLTLAQLAHPQWDQLQFPNRFEIRNAFMQSFDGIDLIRADLLSRIVYSGKKNEFPLHPFGKIQPPMQERITFRIGERYEILRDWLQAYQASSPLDLDIFLSKLFGEVLSQAGFGFHNNYQDAGTVSRMIDSMINFRKLPCLSGNTKPEGLAQEFIKFFREGIIGTQYLDRRNEWNKDAVFIAPAYTFLMLNQPVSYQFWLDVSSMGWWERINQPLTHPVVLSRNWNTGDKWSDAEEYSFNQITLQRIVSGLLYRCMDKIFLCAAGINQSGDEERGPLLQAVQRINLAILHANPDTHL